MHLKTASATASCWPGHDCQQAACRPRILTVGNCFSEAKQKALDPAPSPSGRKEQRRTCSR